MIMILGLLLLCCAAFVAGQESKGPVFILEPIHYADFSNSTGIRLDCAAHGNPPPIVRWTLVDGSPVTNIPGIRSVLRNGSLVFHPFEAREYRQDVHATSYKCEAANPLGVIISRDARMRAVVKQVYEVQVYDEYVIRGNTAVLKCHVPSFVTEYVTVVSWVQAETLVTYSTIELNNRYSMMPTGELHIRGVTANDGYKNYRCRTLNRLTGEIRESSTSGRLIVTEPRGSVQPRITDSQSVVTARQGDKVVLPCASQGIPLPTYTWFSKVSKDQLIPVTVSDRIKLFTGSLVIASAQIVDAGSYVCVVNNSVGIEKVDTTLLVTVPISAYVQPQQQVVDLGQPATFDCVVHGAPVTQIAWFKDGKPLRQDARVRQQTRETVRIEAVRREDRGMWQCHVRNDLEYVQGSAELRLGDAVPELIETFSENMVQPGNSVSLLCLASGNPSPVIAWTIDGQPVTSERLSASESVQSNGDVVSRLNISYVQTEDGGSYSCSARNRGGTVHHTARVNVYGPPYIRPMPKISIVAGDTMTISCPVAGHPIESISWEKDGINLPVNHRQTVHRNGTLTVHLVQRVSDSGKYSCVARNPQGDAARQDVDVTVMVPPLLTPISFQDNHLYEGAHARVTCGVTGGDLPINFRWRKDDNPVPLNVGIQIRDVDEYSSILSISSVNPQHSGNYTCIASNAAASSNYTAKLTVNVPPRWLLEPIDTESRIGDSLTMHCQAHGFPKPTTEWKKAVGETPGNYKEIVPDGYHIQMYANGSLHVSNVTESDRGYYLCHVSNNIGGGLSKVILLNIHIAARFADKRRNYTASEGETAHLVCEAQGDTPIIITWSMNRQKTFMQGRPRYKVDERKLANGLISELSIANIKREDSATFACYADNVYGKDESIIQLIVQEPPDAPSNVRIIDHTSRAVHLAWVAPYDGNSVVVKYVIQFKLATDSWAAQSQNLTVAGTQTTTTLTSLSPANIYHLRVMAVNKIGVSAPSDTISLTSADEAPGGIPKNVKVQASDSRTLKVTWEAPKKSDRHGSIQGYHVGYKQYDSTEPYVFVTVELRTSVIGGEMNQQLTNLMKFNKYSVVVQAYNRLGAGPRSDEVVVMTMEDVPEQPPLGTQCSALSSQSLHVSWEPPPDSAINGVLRGYKVLYTPVDDEYSETSSDVKTTTATKTILHGLDKFTNYSIQVLAFTSVGDGIMSPTMFCRTSEDVPESPADIKVVVTSMESIIVTWKPPLQSNGVVTKYTVYIRSSQQENEETNKHVMQPNSQNSFEATGLKPMRRYDFWVTASTAIGEGQSTRVLSELTGKKVPARIVSLGDKIVTPWKKSLKLSCRMVGVPAPERDWFWGSKKIEAKSNERTRIAADGTLLVSEVVSGDAGNYTCWAKNIYGSDSIYYNITIMAPPSAPTLYLSSAQLTTIDLKWKSSSDGGNPIRGYYLNYKREYGEWEELLVDKKEDSYTLKGLWCGSRYQIYMTAFNKIGTGEPSPILTTKTKGFAPEVPPRSVLLQENSTSILLRLDAWQSGGCPVLYFVVEYKPVKNKEWILVSNNVRPSQQKFIIQDLSPQSWYHIRVTAHNSAGSAVVEHLFVTRTVGGGTVPPDMVGDQDASPLVTDFRVITSVSASVFVIIASLALVCLCIRRQRHHERTEKVEVMGDMQTVPTNPYGQADANHKPSIVQDKGSFTMLLSGNNRNYTSSTSTENFKKALESEDDVCPYATFPIPTGHRDSQGLNHIKPYNIRSSSTNYNPNLLTYSKIQKLGAINNQTKQMAVGTAQPRKEDFISPISESEMSELTISPLIEPFAHLHETRRNFSAQLEQRVPDLLYHKPESSSTETSPDIERRLYQRPGRSRNRESAKQSKSRSNVSDDSQDSNSEETTFCVEKMDQALFYSDSHEFSEAECDRDRRYKYLEANGSSLSATTTEYWCRDLKSKQYAHNYMGTDDPNLILRRLQENPDSGFYSERNTSEDYTIAV